MITARGRGRTPNTEHRIPNGKKGEFPHSRLGVGRSVFGVRLLPGGRAALGRTLRSPNLVCPEIRLQLLWNPNRPIALLPRLD